MLRSGIAVHTIIDDVQLVWESMFMLFMLPPKQHLVLWRTHSFGAELKSRSFNLQALWEHVFSDVCVGLCSRVWHREPEAKHPQDCSL